MNAVPISTEFPADAAHLSEHHEIPREALDKNDSEFLVETLIEFEDAGCARCSELLDTFLARDAERQTCDECRSLGPHCPQHGKFSVRREQ